MTNRRVPDQSAVTGNETLTHAHDRARSDAWPRLQHVLREFLYRETIVAGWRCNAPDCMVSHVETARRCILGELLTRHAD